MIFDILLSSSLLLLMLTGIHTYFGREIVKRGIIFADIAVAQFSGVGIAISLVLFHGEYVYPTSLTFGLIASLLIALSQRLDKYSEAVIGLVYALGFSSTVLILSFSSHGMEELKKLTASDVLFVRLEEVFWTGLLYFFIALLLYYTRRLRGLFRELSFFVLFSVTLASSVRLAGVLVVFSLLVAPALVSVLLKKGLLFAWLWGSFWSLVAIGVSFQLDFPTGYTIVFFQALSGLFVSFMTLARSKGSFSTFAISSLLVVCSNLWK